MSAVRYSATPTPIRTAEDYEKARAAGARFEYRYRAYSWVSTGQDIPAELAKRDPEDSYRAFYPEPEQGACCARSTRSRRSSAP